MKVTDISEVMSPSLPGAGSRVEFVPTKDGRVAMIESAGFQGVRLTRYGDPPCFVKDGVAMRETHIEGWKFPRATG